ncbi:MAG: hypothetical protein OEV66_10475 [Spirochaetia bacterium]|nr:hypothetical protein [Spirochaetia bacterium]
MLNKVLLFSVPLAFSGTINLLASTNHNHNIHAKITGPVQIQVACPQVYAVNEPIEILVKLGVPASGKSLRVVLEIPEEIKLLTGKNEYVFEDNISNREISFKFTVLWLKKINTLVVLKVFLTDSNKDISTQGVSIVFNESGKNIENRKNQNGLEIMRIIK